MFRLPHLGTINYNIHYSTSTYIPTRTSFVLPMYVRVRTSTIMSRTNLGRTWLHARAGAALPLYIHTWRSANSFGSILSSKLVIPACHVPTRLYVPTACLSTQYVHPARDIGTVKLRNEYLIRCRNHR